MAKAYGGAEDGLEVVSGGKKVAYVRLSIIKFKIKNRYKLS